MNLSIKRKLYNRMVVPTVMYGSDTWGKEEQERNELDVMDIKCLKSLCE